MYKIWKYFEKGQVIVCNYQTQLTARKDPDWYAQPCIVNKFNKLLFSAEAEAFIQWTIKDKVLLLLAKILISDQGLFETLF